MSSVCSNEYEAVEYIGKLNGDAGFDCFAFCFDMGHANLLGKNVYNFVTTLGSRIQILHLHDNDGITDLHNVPFVYARSWGPTMADWDGLLRALGDIKYSGVLSFETCEAMYTVPPELRGAMRRFICEIGKYMAGKLA